VAIATRRTRRVEGGTHPRGGSDGTPDDHGNKQNRQAGNAWMLTARTRAARRFRKLVPGRPWAHTSPFPFRNYVIMYCCSYAVNGYIFLISECLHHYWCVFCQLWVQRRDPRWVHDPRRSWGISINVGCPCHSVEFPQKHFLPWMVELAAL